MNESKLSDAALAELLTLTVGVNERGTTYYRNQQGQLHRIHGPAVIYWDGTEYWYRHDRLHREDGPAVEYTDGGESEWWLNDEEFTEEEWHERVKSI